MFVRNLIRVSVGNISAQAISILSVPLITRLYSPTSYGVFSVFLAIAATLYPVVTLRFNAAMMLPDDENTAYNLFILALFTVAASCGIIALIGLIAYTIDFLPETWRTTGVNRILWLIPISVFIQGAGQVASFWNIRQKEFGASALARVLESTVDRGSVLLSGFAIAPNPFSLILGRILGPASSAFYLFKRHFLKKMETESPGFDIASVSNLFIRYRNFALYSTGASLFDMGSRQVPVILMSIWFSSTIVGFYGLAMQVVSLPMLLIGDAIANVFLQRSAEAKEHVDQMQKDARQLLRNILYLVIPATVIFTFFSSDIFSLVFGAMWRESGVYLQILGISFLFTFVHRPFSIYFDVLEKQKARFLFDLTIFFCRILPTIIGGYLENQYIMLVGLTASSSVIYGVGIGYLLNLVGIRASQTIAIFIGRVAAFLPLILGLSAVALFVSTISLKIIMVTGVFALQFAILFVSDGKFRADLRRFKHGLTTG